MDQRKINRNLQISQSDLCIGRELHWLCSADLKRIALKAQDKKWDIQERPQLRHGHSLAGVQLGYVTEPAFHTLGNEHGDTHTAV